VSKAKKANKTSKNGKLPRLQRRLERKRRNLPFLAPIFIVPERAAITRNFDGRFFGGILAAQSTWGIWERGLDLNAVLRYT